MQAGLRPGRGLWLGGVGRGLQQGAAAPLREHQTALIAGYAVLLDAPVPSGPGALLLSDASLTVASGGELTCALLTNWSGSVSSQSVTSRLIPIAVAKE